MSPIQEAMEVRLDHMTHGAPFSAVNATLRAPGRWRRIHFAEVLAVSKGTGRLTLFRSERRHASWRLEPGQMMLLRPTDDTLFHDLAPEGMGVYVISFAIADWRSFTILAGLDPAWATAVDPPVAARDPTDPEVWRPFDALVASSASNPTPYDLLRFWMAVGPRIVPFGSGSGDGAPDWIVRGLEAMREEANLRGGVNRLRLLTHVSPSYLATTTRRFYGATPTTLVNDLRVRHAALLLSTSTEPVGEVARRCGFSSLTYFGRCFRAVFQESPRDYRARARRARYDATVRVPSTSSA